MRLPTRLPIPGAELTSSFGNRIDPFAHSHAFHAGLDFAARAGTPIASAAGGIVAFAGFKRDYGWVVEIDHGNGLSTRYAHASALLVRAGEVVVPGDRIAMVGSTGRSTGAHLHFEILRAGDHVDPGATWRGCERSARHVDGIRAAATRELTRVGLTLAPRRRSAARGRRHAPRRRRVRRRARRRRVAASAAPPVVVRTAAPPNCRVGAAAPAARAGAHGSFASPTRAARSSRSQIDALNQKLTESQDELTFFRQAREGKKH